MNLISSTAPSAPWDLKDVPSAMWHGIQAPTTTSVAIYAGFLTWIFLLAKYLPGRDVQGHPLEGKKERVWYRLNGLYMALITWFAYYVAAFQLKLFPATIIYDNMGPLSSTVLIFVFALSTYLYVSGLASGRGERTGTGLGAFIHDYWAGVELNPSVFGLDLKFLALKVALIGWIVMNMSFAAEQLRLHGKLSDGMIFYQLFTFVYAADYYYHEQAMLSTWDIISEHYGLMLVFGDLWWMWWAFCVQGWYLVNDTTVIKPAAQLALVGFFVAGYYLFRSANSQKNDFKLNPKAPIWGKAPETIAGKILISGWWGILRKANYTGDWMIAIAFALPCGFTHLFAYFYPIYLISLGAHRAIRDDRKCSAKYKDVWVEYKTRVPYAVIPGII